MNDKKSPLSLATVVLNFRTPQMTIECLETIVGEHRAIGNARIIVVDNGSGDDSPRVIAETIANRSWADLVEIIESPENLGFAGGNNLALESVYADNYLLLNSDTLVQEGSILRLLHALDRHPHVGLVGPQLEGPDGRIQQSCFRFRTPITEFLAAARTGPLSKLFASHIGTIPYREGPSEPEWTCFACCLIRGKVFEQIGYLDAGYFMYFDDIDYCRRARKAGWRVLYWPQARVVHLIGQSGPTMQLGELGKRRPRFYYAARNRYFAKSYGRVGLWVTNFCWEIGRIVSWLRERVGVKMPHTCEREACDIWTNAWNPIGATEPDRAEAISKPQPLDSQSASEPVDG